jgi:ATP-dependent RNA helicase DeaD
MRFKDIDLRPEIQKALEEMGYKDLSPIQEMTILPIIEDRDLVALAETGSGKTGACGVPLIQLIDETIKEIQVLILVPTRELALQYVSELENIAKHTQIKPLAVYGGVPMSMQLLQKKAGVHILVATPGRLIDMLHTGELNFRMVRTLVLDEADEMLDMGFIEDVEFIASCIIAQHQVLLFSATMPREIERLIQRFLHDPVRIQLNKDMVAPSSLVHEFMYIPTAAAREEMLINFLQDRSQYRQVLIFFNSRFKGEQFYKSIRRRIPRSAYLHGGMEQEVRIEIFDEFKRGDLSILFATDVAGRGLDFSNVSHVINYDFPRTEVAYTHRTGRAGRMGRKGTAISFVTGHDLRVAFSVIEQNHLEPHWIGREPTHADMERPRGGSRGGHGHGGRPPRNGGRR